MNIGTPQLIALAPLAVVLLTTVVVMLSIAWRRNHALSAGLTVIGLNVALAATLFAAARTPGPLAITGLLVLDEATVVGSVAILVSVLGCATLFRSYLEGVQDNREEMYLLLLCGASGALVLAGATHMASFFIGLELMSVRSRRASSTSFSRAAPPCSCSSGWHWSTQPPGHSFSPFRAPTLTQACSPSVWG